MATINSKHPMWARLFGLWKSEGRPGTVIIGSDVYRVLTPNGEEEPLFVGQASEIGTEYEQVSFAPGLPQVMNQDSGPKAQPEVDPRNVQVDNPAALRDDKPQPKKSGRGGKK